VPTTFLVMAMFLAATLAFERVNHEVTEGKEIVRASNGRCGGGGRGALGGLAVLFRPTTDCLRSRLAYVGNHFADLECAGKRSATPLWLVRVPPSGGINEAKSRLKAGLRTDASALRAAGATPSRAHWRSDVVLARVCPHAGALDDSQRPRLSSFPATVAGAWRMPGEFVPRGYNQWLRTWVDDEVTSRHFCGRSIVSR